MKPFGALLREHRRTAGYTLEAIAAHLDVSIPYMSDVERGNRPPLTPERIEVLSKFLCVDPEPLLAAAAESRGTFELDAKKSVVHRDVGAVLMRGWTDLTRDELERIGDIVRKRSNQ